MGLSQRKYQFLKNGGLVLSIGAKLRVCEGARKVHVTKTTPSGSEAMVCYVCCDLMSEMETREEKTKKKRTRPIIPARNRNRTRPPRPRPHAAT